MLPSTLLIFPPPWSFPEFIVPRSGHRFDHWPSTCSCTGPTTRQLCFWAILFVFLLTKFCAWLRCCWCSCFCIYGARPGSSFWPCTHCGWCTRWSPWAGRTLWSSGWSRISANSNIHSSNTYRLFSLTWSWDYSCSRRYVRCFSFGWEPRIREHPHDLWYRMTINKDVRYCFSWG